MSINAGERMCLRPITNKDIEIFRTMVFVSKLKNRRNEILKSLTEKYRKEPKDFESILAYAIFNMLPYETDEVLGQIESIEESISAFDLLLKMEPGYWLARYYKIRLLSSFSNSFRDKSELMNDLDCIIELQNNSGSYEPYFALSYLLYAEVKYNVGEQEESREFIRKATSLTKDAIDILPDFLYNQLDGFEERLRMSGELEMADDIRKLGKVLFPKAKA